VIAIAPEPARISVLGLGNVLFGDDGFGPFVVQSLRAGWDFPPRVVLVDVGTPGLDLVTYVQGTEMVILLDAVGATGAPGELRLYRGRELKQMQPKPRVSPHDPAVLETLLITELAGDGPQDILLVGVIPQSLDLGVGLSAAVCEAAAAASELVVRELANVGAGPVPRHSPDTPDVWWMRGCGLPVSPARS
jgi:hydrogenase maturation protease